MSRLIVKGLPKNFKDKDLKKLVQPFHPPTDARVMHTKDGKSRQFGFVGFNTPEHADAVRSALHNTFVGINRVSVELAHKIGDNSIPRPWSKYSKGSSMYEKLEEGREMKERKQFLKNEQKRLANMRKLKRENEGNSENNAKDCNSLLPQFMEAAGRRSQNPIWADGNVKVDMVASRKTGGEGKFLKRTHVTFDDDSDEENNELYEDIPEQPVKENDNEDNSKSEKHGGDVALDDKVSDADYFKSKIVGGDTVENDESEEEENDNLQNTNNSPENKRMDDRKENPTESIQEIESNGKHSHDLNENEGTPAKGRMRTPSPPKRPKKNYISDGVDAAETGRLMVRNLAFSTTEEDLETLFETFGHLAEVHVVRDSDSGKSRGMGFIQYVVHENAGKALLNLDGTFQGGRIIHILPAIPRRSYNSVRTSVASTKPGSSSFKNERDAALKDAAKSGNDAISQHALHMSGDAVAAVAAEKQGVSKSSLLGLENGNSGIAAVRIAMAEAAVQSETRHFLLQHGVDISVAAELAHEMTANTPSAKKKRKSRRAFLAKNLPAMTKNISLERMFRRYGSLSRIIVVPSGVMAVIEYKTAAEAKEAYSDLAYSKFEGAPLYLEWLPNAALKEAAGVPSDRDPSKSGNSGKTVIHEDEEDDDEENLAECSVYVKNLNFDTRDDALKDHFFSVLKKRPKVANSLRSAKVAMKSGPEGKEESKLSMGFGFLEFDTPEDAVEAVKIAQNSKLDGHILNLRLSNRGKNQNIISKLKRKRSTKQFKPCSKLIVRNVAFQATKKDIRRLFGVFGEIKTVRLPTRMDGSHRGFAFVEFLSKGEATAAYEALAAAHLYGRHLVIEYADSQDTNQASIAELQAKTAKYVSKKRIRRNDGTTKELIDGEKPNEEEMDEQAQLQDSLYG